jgi:hypothetical protein
MSVAESVSSVITCFERSNQFLALSADISADEVEKHMDHAGGLFRALKPHVKTLHGYTHGGLE